MSIRSFGALLAIGVALPAGAQQTVRWNPAIDLGPSDPPPVHVWIDGPRMAPQGSAIRVRFVVEEDAHVIVARVDWRGHLTLLYPSGRTRSTLVPANEEVAIRGARLGGFGSFVANESFGASGYVFALASHTPFNLSRLSIRDFDRYVTGVSMGQPAPRYIGDPYRVITRFARIVMPFDDAEFEYDIDYYSVDRPTWASAAGYSSYCRSSYWNSPWYYGARSIGSWYDEGDELGCGFLNSRYGNCYGYGYSWLYGYSPLTCYGGPRYVVSGGQAPPTVPPPLSDSIKVNPWVPDSIRAPSPGVLPPDRLGVDRMPPPVPVGGDADDLTFSIPSRALRGMRERNRDAAPVEPGSSGPRPNPTRPEIVNGGSGAGDIDWIRPPRAVDRAGDDPLPPRQGRTRDFVSTRDREPASAPPTRTERPSRTDRSSDWDQRPMPTRDREIRTEGSRGSSGGSPAREYSPPPRSDPPPRAEPTRAPSSSGGDRRPPAEERRPPSEERRPPAEERRPPSEERRPH